MAVPCSFDESDAVLGRPADMTDDQCAPLSIRRTHFCGVPCVVSCWKLTEEEMSLVIRTGRIWLTVAGSTMPAVFIGGEKPEM